LKKKKKKKKKRGSGPDPPGGGGGSDGSNRKNEVRPWGDAVWLQHPRRSQPSGNKKVLPYKELNTLAKEMFNETGNGVPLHENFLRCVHEVATNNLRECLSLLDLESNVQHYLQRQGFVPRPAFSGLDQGETYVKQPSVVATARQRMHAANNLLPQSQMSDQALHHGKSTTTCPKDVEAMVDRHLEVLIQHGLDAEGEDAYRAP